MAVENQDIHPVRMQEGSIVDLIAPGPVHYAICRSILHISAFIFCSITPAAVSKSDYCAGVLEEFGEIKNMALIGNDLASPGKAERVASELSQETEINIRPVGLRKEDYGQVGEALLRDNEVFISQLARAQSMAEAKNQIKEPVVIL